MAVYVLNAIPGAAMIGHHFRGRPIGADEFIAAANAADTVSAIGHQATADALAAWFGDRLTRPLAVNRTSVAPAPGDTLIVAVLRGPRLAEGEILDRDAVLARGFDFLRIDIDPQD